MTFLWDETSCRTKYTDSCLIRCYGVNVIDFICPYFRHKKGMLHIAVR